MAVIRVEKNNNYTTMSNVHLRDKELSLKACGLLSKVLALPDNWEYSVNGLVAICKENITTVKNAMKELEDHGYLKVNKFKNDKGQFVYDYTFRENPESKKPDLESLGVESLEVESLDLENQHQLNTNISNTNILNTYDIKDIVVKDDNIPYQDIINYLNERANTSFKHTSNKTKELIKARYKEGFNIDDFKKVIDVMVIKWGNDKKMRDYLRPLTLFSNKFESYLNTRLPDNHELSTKDINNYISNDEFMHILD